MNTCHHCLSTNVIKKGFAGSGKQRCLCKTCQRTFVVGGDSWHVSPSKKELIHRLLLERLSLRGICRVTGVPLRWPMDDVEEKYEGMPDDLNFTTSLEKVREAELLSS